MAQPLGANHAALILYIRPNDATNHSVTNTPKSFCNTPHDKVRVQFIPRDLKTATHEGRAAFRAPLPDSVLRLQRREYYRLTMPVTQRLACRIPQPDGHLVEVESVALSGGGLAVARPPDAVAFQPAV